ncbi:MAG: DEAD/DEAH box helicase, partial [Deltaproteobacteria bacterium]|nr:DEAD/DEAH box helicase [Deltaproteobacteria bacterium]
MTFEELQLAPPILKALARCGHHNPTTVQGLAIPKVLAGHDVIASAQTGTGKTAAFVLPALQRLCGRPRGFKPGLRVVVMTPTRELADQITQVARDYGKYLKVNSVSIVGGMPFGEQFRALSQMPDMIVGTPGRLIDHIMRGKIDLSQVELLVLDEADRMLEMGFIGDVKFMSEATPKDCQTLLFAATMGDATAKLALKYMKNPERVEVAPGKITHDTIEQRLHLADSLPHKKLLLNHLCADTTVTRAIIFSATKRGADQLAKVLDAKGYPAAALHADMTQSARNRTIMEMRRGKIRLLVATDVAARGLDIDGISHVINFDLPRSAEDYVNRIGRTGRAGASGIAISFASQPDFPYLDRIERYLGHNLAEQVIPGLEPDQPGRRQMINARSDKRAAATGSRRPVADSGKRVGRGAPRKASHDKTVAVEYVSGKSGRPGPGRKRKSEEKNTHVLGSKSGVANLSFSYEGMADNAKRTGPGAPRKASFDKTVAVEYVSGKSGRPGPGRKRKPEEKNTRVPAGKGGVSNLSFSYEGMADNSKRVGQGAPRKASFDKTAAVENVN